MVLILAVSEAEWGAPCGSCPKMTFNGLEPTSHRQIAEVSDARVMGDRYRPMLEGGVIFFVVWCQ